MLVALTYNQKKESAGKGKEDYYLEFDEPATIEAVFKALSIHYEVVKIEADPAAFEKFKKYSPDIVFNIAEGEYTVSRESQIPAMLDMLQIPYTGSAPLTLGICLNKVYSKKILTYHQVPTPAFKVIGSDKDIKDIKDFPLIVKPLGEGSSKGIFNNSLVRKKEELFFHVNNIFTRYKQPALVEEFLSGREFTAAVLGNRDNLKILPLVKISFDSLPPKANHLYSYEAKWIWDRDDDPLDIFECPAKIPAELEKKIMATVEQAYTVLECHDWARIDVRLNKEDIPYILEVNPLPGILPDTKSNSCFPKAARTCGMDYNELINLVLEIALKRYKIPHETDYCGSYL